MRREKVAVMGQSRMFYSSQKYKAKKWTCQRQESKWKWKSFFFPIAPTKRWKMCSLFSEANSDSNHRKASADSPCVRREIFATNFPFISRAFHIIWRRLNPDAALIDSTFFVLSRYHHFLEVFLRALWSRNLKREKSKINSRSVL